MQPPSIPLISTGSASSRSTCCMADRATQKNLTFLRDNGMTLPEYNWFMSSPPPSGRRIQVEDVLGLHTMGKDYYARYQMPLMHIETNVLDAVLRPRGYGSNG
jgi:hypothetical protein